MGKTRHAITSCPDGLKTPCVRTPDIKNSQKPLRDQPTAREQNKTSLTRSCLYARTATNNNKTLPPKITRENTYEYIRAQTYVCDKKRANPTAYRGGVLLFSAVQPHEEPNHSSPVTRLGVSVFVQPATGAHVCALFFMVVLRQIKHLVPQIHQAYRSLPAIRSKTVRSE